MSDKFSKNPWGMDWSDLQSSYMDSVNSFFQQGMNPGASSGFGFGSTTPWDQAMDYWWQSNRHAMPTDQYDLLNKMMNQGRTLYFFGDQLSQLMRTMAEQKQGAEAWQSHLDQQFEMMKQTVLEQGSRLYANLGSELNSAQDAWRALLKNLPGMQNLEEEGISQADINEYIEKYLSMPGVGLSRELQEKVQKTLLSFKDYQENLADYQTAMNEVTVAAMDKLKDKLSTMGKNKETVESLRHIYDIWVDCNEDSYAEFVLTEEYSKLYGRLVNSMMHYKKNQAELTDEFNSANNLPTRTDFNEMIREQHQLKYQLKRTQRARDEEKARLDDLEQELALLRDKVKAKAIEKEKPAKQKAKAAPKKTTKKKTARKTASAKSAPTKKNKPVKPAAKVTKKKTSRRKKPATSTQKKTDNVIEIKF